jgi:hypothetical protein
VRFSAGEILVRAGVDREALRSDLPNVDPSRIPVWAAPAWFRIFWAPWVTAVALPWGVYVHPRRLGDEPEDLARLMVHELVHIGQWRRLGVAGWLRAYVGAYLAGRRSGLGRSESYRAIPLEVEARDVSRRHAP